jgi:hypothetical protein
MTYKAKVAICSEMRTKHSTQSEHHVELLNVKPSGTSRKRWALKVNTFSRCVNAENQETST